MSVKSAKKKATSKPKPPSVPENAIVIEISPDNQEEKKSGSFSSSQNKDPQLSLTSALTARAKLSVALTTNQKNEYLRH